MIVSSPIDICLLSPFPRLSHSYVQIWTTSFTSFQLSTDAGQLLSTFMGPRSLTTEFHRKTGKGGKNDTRGIRKLNVVLGFSFLKWIQPEYVSNCFSSESSWNRDQSGHRGVRSLSFTSCSTNLRTSTSFPCHFPGCSRSSDERLYLQ